MLKAHTQFYYAITYLWLHRGRLHRKLEMKSFYFVGLAFDFLMVFCGCLKLLVLRFAIGLADMVPV
jgi:hypothetical protein